MSKSDPNQLLQLVQQAKAGNRDKVLELLDQGVEVDEKNNDITTAFIFAAQEGRTEIVELLLERGAKVDEKDNSGGEYTALISAAQAGHIEMVELLLERGAKVDEKNNYYGATALIIAAHAGHIEIVKLFLERGAKVDEKANNGATALIIAAEEGYTEIVELLLEKGAKVDEKANNGITSLIVAAKKGRIEIVELLLERGAKVDEKTNYGSTALIQAAHNGHAKIVKLLLERGAKVDEKTNYGSTALILAAEEGHTEIVELLLEKGAKIDEKANNVEGYTALTIAARYGHTESAKLLLEKGANFDYLFCKNELNCFFAAMFLVNDDTFNRITQTFLTNQELRTKFSNYLNNIISQDFKSEDLYARGFCEILNNLETVRPSDRIEILTNLNDIYFDHSNAVISDAIVIRSEKSLTPQMISSLGTLRDYLACDLTFSDNIILSANYKQNEDFIKQVKIKLAELVPAQTNEDAIDLLTQYNQSNDNPAKQRLGKDLVKLLEPYKTELGKGLAELLKPFGGDLEKGLNKLLEASNEIKAYDKNKILAGAAANIVVSHLIAKPPEALKEIIKDHKGLMQLSFDESRKSETGASQEIRSRTANVEYLRNMFIKKSFPELDDAANQAFISSVRNIVAGKPPRYSDTPSTMTSGVLKAAALKDQERQR